MARSIEEVHQLVLKGDVHSFYVTDKWRKKRKEILARDNNTCQRCLGKWTDERYPIKKSFESRKNLA